MRAFSQHLTNISLWVSMALLACVTLLTTIDVTCRLFGSSVSGVYQMSELMEVWIICLAWPMTEATKGHVNMDIVVSRLSKQAQRRIDFICNCLTLLAFLFIIWQGAAIVKRNYGLHEIIPIVEISLYPFQLVIPVAATINSLVLITRLLEFCKKGPSAGEGQHQPQEGIV